MKIIWEVSDGYFGNGKHHSIIPDEELEGLDEDEIEELINDWVDDDFNDSVTWHIVSKER